MSAELLSEDERLLQSMVREFADDVLAPRAPDYDQRGEFPWENVRELAELGLFGLTIDEEYGGSGGTTRQLAIAVEEIARGCGSTSVIYVAHLGLCTHFILRFGTPEQKERWVPPLARAEKIGAFALTEPLSGSDSAAMRTTVEKRGESYVLNGSKLFTTNAEEAEVFVVLATHDRQQRTRGIDALVVERGADGFTINPQHGKMGMRATSTAELVFEDCAVPEGEPDRGRRTGLHGDDGRAQLQPHRDRRPVRRPRTGRVRLLGRVCPRREAFGQRLADFQGIQWELADMATDIEAARGLVMRSATLRDEGTALRDRGVDGQAVRLAPRRPVRRQGRADSRRHRLFRPYGRRAPVQGLQGDRDLRGHDRDPAHDHSAQPARPVMRSMGGVG